MLIPLSSHPFWDEYIKFEQEKGTEKRLINLYKTIIQRPIHQYAKYFTELAKLLPNTPIDQFVTLATLDQFKLDYQKQLESKPKDKQKDESAEDKSKATEGDVQEVQTEDQYLRDRVAKYYDQMFQKYRPNQRPDGPLNQNSSAISSMFYIFPRRS